ncbi:MAG: phenylalanine--tRNA ligase subunit beta [Halanaerobiaceae bacterium]|nr:phenylalanine--tRNA ligase subunit beta [Halanaerobiaceae bacterium]
MQVSYKWLREYIDLSCAPEELEYILTMAGMEVEEVECPGKGIEDIVIGEVKKIRKHPNADKLLICEVDTGDELINIVTGAPNVFEGARVPVAKTGTELPNGMVIKKTKLRGEMSYGMMCSTDELGLSEERADGIMILGEDAQKGMKLIEYLNLDDFIYKLDLTPNFARCLGMLGIARELEALQAGKGVKYPAIEIKEGSEDIEKIVAIEVLDPDLCPRYTGQIIRNVKIGPSPLWMQQRLTAGGIRPINNVVDITNYVMLEYNQPLHAFDFDKISGNKVIVRRAEEGEKLVTLDGQERELTRDMLVIADSSRAIGLAGVMGGANSEIDDRTTTIFLESAFFDPVSIRKTARALGLPSEASHRFERGVDIEKVLEAGRRAAYLMQEYAGGEVVKGTIDVYPEPYQAKEIRLDLSYVNQLLGIETDISELEEMLLRLKFSAERVNNETLKVTVPGFRTDMEREADLAEEVARIYGYNNIPENKPASKQQGKRNFRQLFEDITRERLTAAGLDEIISFSLAAEEDYRVLMLPQDSELYKWVRIKNPLNEAYAVLRTSLLPGLLDVLSNNAKRQIEKMHIFELGNVFFNEEGEYREYMKLAGASMGYDEDCWNSGAADFFYLKGVLESYFEYTGIDNPEFRPVSLPYLHPGRSAEIRIGKDSIGFLGELYPDIIKELDLKAKTAVFQLDFEMLLEKARLFRTYEELPRYPASERDLAILVSGDIHAYEILKEIRVKGGDLLKEATLFDLYQGDQIPAGKKSLAFKLLFQALDRTLRDEEVNALMEKIIKSLEEKFAAKIRGN